MKFLRQLIEEMETHEEDCLYTECWVDEDNNILSEAAVRMFKRIGKEIKRRYRCTTGPKKGKPVSDPKLCATRKDPKKKRIGRKVARTRKGIRIRKSKITKRTAMSKMVARMNKRLKGARSAPKSGVAKTPKNTNTKSTVQPQQIKGLGTAKKVKKVKT
ncbi:MAG: hypothetical protein ACXADH_16335, partial [Candidatus Kariarchaeaceae archaeon]